MQSKTSSSDFFNKTLFKKNRKRFWPIWAGYSFLIFWMLCAMTYLSLHMSFFGIGKDELWHSTISFIYGEAIRSTVWPAIIFSMLTALAVFSYLGNERSCYYFHSLPQTRGQLLSNGYISGLGMMFIPNLVMYLIANLFCITDGLVAIKALSTWLLVITVEELFFFSLAALCMIIFGNNIAAPVIYTIFLFFAEGMQLLLNDLYMLLFFGASSSLIEIPDGNPLGIISPVRFFGSFYFNVNEKVAEKGVYDCYYPERMWLVLITALVVSALFIAASAFLYNRRKSEHAGDIVAIEFLRPVFRWGVGISFAILFTTLITETLLSAWNYTTRLMIIVFVLLMIFGIIAYIAAEMIIKKSFRVFKGLGRKFGLYVGFIALVAFIMMFAGCKVVSYIPDRSDVKELRVSVNGYVYTFTDDEDIDRLASLHNRIVEDKDRIVDISLESRYGHTMNTVFIYKKNDGTETERRYHIPVEYEVASDIEDFLSQHAIELIFGNLEKETYYSMELTLLNKNMEYEFKEFYSSESKEIARRLIKDYESGYITLKQMAPDFLSDYMYNDVPDNSYRIELVRKYHQDYDYEYTNTLYILYVNENCVNTMEYLRRYVDFENYK